MPACRGLPGSGLASPPKRAPQQQARRAGHSLTRGLDGPFSGRRRRQRRGWQMLLPCAGSAPCLPGAPLPCSVSVCAPSSVSRRAPPRPDLAWDGGAWARLPSCWPLPGLCRPTRLRSCPASAGSLRPPGLLSPPAFPPRCSGLWLPAGSPTTRDSLAVSNQCRY